MIDRTTYISLPSHQWNLAEKLIVDKKIDAVDKMLENYQRHYRKPDWILNLPKDRGVACIWWKRQILVKEPK